MNTEQVEASKDFWCSGFSGTDVLNPTCACFAEEPGSWKVAGWAPGVDCSMANAGGGGGDPTPLPTPRPTNETKANMRGYAMVGLTCGSDEFSGCGILAPRFFGEKIGSKLIEPCDMLIDTDTAAWFGGPTEGVSKQA